MTFLYEYTSEQDKEIAVIESVIDNKLMHLNMSFEKLMLEHAQNLSDIETKVLVESGTADDLLSLYIAEAEEIKEKGKGIIGSIIDAVRRFFRKIKKFFVGGDVNEDKLPDKIKLNENPDELIKQANDLMTKTESSLKSKKSLKAIAGGLVGTIAGAFIYKKAVKPTINNLSRMLDEQDTRLGRIQDEADKANLSPEEQGYLKTIINNIKSCGSRALKIVKAIPQIGSEDYKDAAEANKTDAEEAKKAKSSKTDEPKEDKADDKNDNKIKKAQDTQVISNQRISELIDENGRIEKLIKSTKAKLKEVKKDKGASSDSLAGNVSASLEQRELAKLQRLRKEGKLKDSQRSRLVSLQSKYGVGNINRDKKISELENTLDFLENKLKANLEKIDNRSEESLSAKEAEVEAKLKKASKGNVSSSSKKLDEIEKMLNESVCEPTTDYSELTFQESVDYFDELINEIV